MTPPHLRDGKCAGGQREALFAGGEAGDHWLEMARSVLAGNAVAGIVRSTLSPARWNALGPPS